MLKEKIAASLVNIAIFAAVHHETMRPLPFHKFHGTGNDFIMVDDRQSLFPENDYALISRLCERRTGIGADGLILIRPEKGYDFRMVYFNSDGREGSMCGNGGRCAVAFADFLSPSHGESCFIAYDGEHCAQILRHEGSKWTVRLKMRDVREIRKMGESYFVDTGSPHCIRIVENITDMDVVVEGRKIRNDPFFGPDGTNVNFITLRDSDFSIRSYERGVEDETLSCGTGTIASALIYALIKGIESGEVSAESRGGLLKVSFKRAGEAFSDIYIEGPAVQVFSGEMIV